MVDLDIPPATLRSVQTDPRFWNQIGPFGGWLAAQAFHALAADVPPGWAPRALHVQFLGAVAAGAFDVDVREVRRQRSVWARSARLMQGGPPAVTAEAVFAPARPDGLVHAAPRPAWPDPLQRRRWRGLQELAAFVDAFDYRLVLGPPFEGAAQADTGGWLRLDGSKSAPDLPDLLLLADAWFPALWTTLDAPVPVTTVSWHVMFHDTAPPPAGGHGFIAARHRADVAADGWGHERGELWWPDGRLALQAQQLVWVDARKAHRRHPAP